MSQVTVLMAVHNAAPFLREAVDSVLRQTFKDFEFLIIDDGSTDGTSEILAAYMDARIRVIRLVKNSGLVAALNVGIDESQSDLIARMDGDDICEPQRLEFQVAFLRQHPNVLLLGTGFVRISRDGRPFERVLYPTDDAVLQERLLDASQFCHPSVMMRTDVVRRLGGYRDVGRGPAEDYDLWLRIAEQGQIANLPEVLLRYRIHEGQTSVGKLARQRQTAHVYKVLALQRRAGETEDVDAAQSASNLDRADVVRALRADYLRWAGRFAATGQRGLAMRLMLSAHRLDRWHPGPWLGLGRIMAAELESSSLGKRVRWYSRKIAGWVSGRSLRDQGSED